MRFALITAVALGALLSSCERERPQPLEPDVNVAALQDGKSSFEWSEPVWLGPVVNSPARDLNPELSPDGLSLYFTSFRDGAGHIYVSQRADEACAWGAPVKLGPPINGDGFQFSPDVSPDGHYLYFASNGHGGFGDADIFMSYREDVNDDFAWGPPVNLGPPVNTAAGEQGPQFSAPGGGELYFNRVLDPTLIFVVPMTMDGRFSGDAVPVEELNFAAGMNAEVAVRGDGRELMFWSGSAATPRPGSVGATDIFVSTRQNPNSQWSEPQSLGRPVNYEGSDLVPTLSTDGRTLIYSTHRPGGLGLPDLWMSVRSPHGDVMAELGDDGLCSAP